jgi:hypothetical protein
MPFAFKAIALRSQVPNNSADFMCRKSRINGDGKVMEPKLGFEVPGSDVNMGRLAALV